MESKIHFPKKKTKEKEIARYWDSNAESWGCQVRNGKDGYREYVNNPAFFKFIGNVRGKKVLDAGCGEGYNTRILAQKGAKVTGIDISQKMIHLATEEENLTPLGIKYRVASLSNLNMLDDSSFDTIVSFMVLMDTDSYEDILKEFYRVLDEDGSLLFSVTHACFLTKGLSWLKDDEGNFTKITASNYFDKEPYTEKWKFTNDSINPQQERFTVLCFPRTLEEYINPLIEAGFHLKKIMEPKPRRNLCKDRPWLSRWQIHAALFLYVCAIK